MTDRAQHLIDGAERMALSAHRGDSDAEKIARLGYELGTLRMDVRRLCAEIESLPWLVKSATKHEAVQILRELHAMFPGNDIDNAADCLQDEIDEENVGDPNELRAEINNDDRWMEAA
jgi:hypothetical protein